MVWSLFYWQEGEVRFQIGSFQPPGGVRIQLPMRQVILQGIKRAPNAKALVARLGKKETVFDPGFTTEDLIQAGARRRRVPPAPAPGRQAQPLRGVHAGAAVAAENAKLVYAFYVLRLVRRQEAATERGRGRSGAAARGRGAPRPSARRSRSASRPAATGSAERPRRPEGSRPG